MTDKLLELKVSVIVPVYNAEGTIEFTVKSIQEQTYKNIEIILVDDGSVDKSSEICDTLAKNDQRVKVIHQQNSGVSVARNSGITQAEGEFLCFVDADDEIEADMIEKLVEAHVQSGAQLVTAGIKEIHKNEEVIKSPDNMTIDLENVCDNVVIDLCSNNLMVFMTSKLFLRKIFVDNDLSLKPGLVCGEDHLIVFEYLRYVNKISFINYAPYIYNCLNLNGTKRFFPLTGQIDIFKAKENFVKKICNESVAEEYCAKNALRNFIARVNYLAKRNILDFDEIGVAYDFYYPFIIPYVNNKDVFYSEDQAWLKANKKSFLNKNIKAFFEYCEKEKAAKKKAKQMENIKEVFNMPLKEKVKFILKKIK